MGGGLVDARHGRQAWASLQAAKTLAAVRWAAAALRGGRARGERRRRGRQARASLRAAKTLAVVRLAAAVSAQRKTSRPCTCTACSASSRTPRGRTPRNAPARTLRRSRTAAPAKTGLLQATDRGRGWLSGGR